MRFRWLTWAPAILAGAIGVSVISPDARASTCAQAAQSAEQRRGLPSGLLAAIGHVESGEWGWSVNGNDGAPGRRFASAEDAVRYTDGLLGSGRRTIDVGCFQVDLRYHPDAFEHWQDAFDGDANANAAADILSRLHDRTGDWSRAVALYHSADPSRGQSYLQEVMSAWGGSLTSVSGTPEDAGYVIVLRPTIIPVSVWVPGGVRVAGSMPSRGAGRLPRVITP